MPKNAGELFEVYLKQLAKHNIVFKTEEEKEAALFEFMKMFFFREVMVAEEKRNMKEITKKLFEPDTSKEKREG